MISEDVDYDATFIRLSTPFAAVHLAALRATRLSNSLKLLTGRKTNHPTSGSYEHRSKCRPTQLSRAASGCRSLTMTYFHTGPRTIIGAEAFHCPVRDGKEWDHLAMVVRHNLLPACSKSTQANS